MTQYHFKDVPFETPKYNPFSELELPPERRTHCQSKEGGRPVKGSAGRSRHCWRVPAYVPDMFDKTAYESVIPPQRFEQVPLRRFKTRTLVDGKPEFYHRVDSLPKPFSLYNNLHVPELVPRTLQAKPSQPTLFNLSNKQQEGERQMGKKVSMKSIGS